MGAAWQALPCSHALHVELPLFTHVLLVPLVFIVGLIPISFAGWGIRVLGAIGLYGLAGVEPEAATARSVLFGLILLVTGIPAGCCGSKVAAQ
jgi:uncharacterized membrane protein YbhN (UPF0104 family)